MDCKECKENRQTVPYVVHEAGMARMSKLCHTLIIGWIITVFLLVGSWAGFLWYESQFTDEVVTESYEATADNDSIAIANGSGEVNYGG